MIHRFVLSKTGILYGRVKGFWLDWTYWALPATNPKKDGEDMLDDVGNCGKPWMDWFRNRGGSLPADSGMR